MLKRSGRRDYASGPGGPPGATAAAALTDVQAAIKAVLTAIDLPTARTALGLGSVANLAPADLPVSTAAAAALATLATQVAANQATLAAILGGAPAALDTFVEAYNRFLADESAAAAMLASITALQTALTAEVTRAQGAEATNATNIGNNATAIANEVTRATGVEATLAPKGRQILAAGLATGGGDLTVDRTITVPKASQADVTTGTDDARALTAYAVSARFALTAPLASPVFTGTPAAPTPAAGTNTTQIATTAFVASALGSYLTTAAAAATYAPLASPALTGTPTAPTAAAGTNTTQLATTGFVTGALGSYLTTTSAAATYAPLASPAFTGTPTAPTAAAGTNTTQVATTAFVLSAVSSGTNAAVTYTPQSLTGAQQGVVRSNIGLNSAGAVAFRNRLVNGNFAINQRGATSASTAYSAGAYVMDRWKAGSNGCTLSFATAANGDVTVTITAGTLVQVIEGGLYLPEGGAYVLSWSGTATARVYQGTATGAYAASPVAASGLTAGTNTTVEFGTGTIGLAQFELGTTATAFERRDDEKRRCERYYEVSQCYIYFNAYAAGANVSQQVRMTEKRVAPSVSVSGISASNANSPSATVLNTKEIMFVISSTAQALTYYQFNYYASSEL